MDGFTTSSKTCIFNLSLFICRDVFAQKCQKCLSFLSGYKKKCLSTKHLSLVAIIQNEPSGSILRMALFQELKGVGYFSCLMYNCTKEHFRNLCYFICSNFVLIVLFLLF